jgi:hypothetical protein
LVGLGAVEELGLQGKGRGGEASSFDVQDYFSLLFSLISSQRGKCKLKGFLYCLLFYIFIVSSLDLSSGESIVRSRGWRGQLAIETKHGAAN